MTKTKDENVMCEWRTEGSCLYHKTADGGEELVTTTTPHLFSHAVDKETGTYYTTVTFRSVDGRIVMHTLDRRDLFDEARIVDALSPLGAMVSSTNATLIVKWLTDECSAKEGQPIALASTHLGWVEGSEGAFLPWRDKGVRLVVPDGMRRLNKAFEPAGTVFEWAKEVGVVREKSMACRAMLAASAAAPLVRMLDLQPFVVYLWHKHYSKRHATLQTAGSVWGDAGNSAGYLLPHVPPLPVAMNVASYLRDVPYLQANLLTRADKWEDEPMRRATNWALTVTSGDAHTAAPALTLATGEIPLIEDSNRDTLRGRVLELNNYPIYDAMFDPSMDDVAHRLHGTAGQRIVHILAECGPEATYRMWEAALERYDRLLPDKHLKDMIVLLCLGDALLRRAAFFQGESLTWDKALEEAEKLCRWLRQFNLGLGDGYTDRRSERSAGRSLLKWIDDNDDDISPYGDEEHFIYSFPLGYYANEERTKLMTERSTVIEQLSKEGYEADWVLYGMSDDGVVTECPQPEFLEPFRDDYSNDWLLIDIDALNY